METDSKVLIPELIFLSNLLINDHLLKFLNSISILKI